MNKSLFIHIVHRLSAEVEYFHQTQDALGRSSLSPLQKSRKCLHKFTAGIILLFGDEYLRRPTPEDLARLLHIREQRGFPGMIGSIDCTMNDLNILDGSPVFDDIINGIAPEVNFNVNGTEYDMAYYLTDGIYLKWMTFIQSIRLPQGPKNSLFAKTQEAVRKDVERAFGVLQARFAVVKNPSKLWDKDKISNIMRACIILHNMIVEDERASFTQYNAFEFQEREDEDSFSVNMPSHLGNTMDRRTSLRNRQTHQQLNMI
uniref:DDE Tnp4 domain-containing protein n=1 Tax=Brassica oleracea var. oleracea TaxID=109376 RepID=A0A0D3DB79_BRAOL